MNTKIAATISLFVLSLPLTASALSGAATGQAAGGTEGTGNGLILSRAQERPASGISEGILLSEPAGQVGDAGAGKRSPSIEAAMSLLLPGLGQYRMGREYRYKIYFGLEAAAWITSGAFYWQSIARRDAFEEYAVAYAGVNGTGHSKNYYDDVADYYSSDGPYSYNEYVLREARDLYFPDQEAMEAYYEENKIPPELSWRWETEKAYLRFNRLISGYEASQRRAVYALFFMMGLRIVSAVDAYYMVKGADAGGERQTGMSIEIDPAPGGFRLGLSRRF